MKDSTDKVCGNCSAYQPKNGECWCDAIWDVNSKPVPTKPTRKCFMHGGMGYNWRGIE